MTAQFKDRPLIVEAPPKIFFVCLGIGLLLHYLRPVTMIDIGLGFRIVGGLPFFAAAGGIALAAFRSLKKHRTPFNPYKPTTRVVQDGPFGFSRNPLYLALTFVFIGFALITLSLFVVIAGIVFVGIIDRGVIGPEETYLEAKFGDEYRQYKKRVRKWL